METISDKSPNPKYRNHILMGKELGGYTTESSEILFCVWKRVMVTDCRGKTTFQIHRSSRRIPWMNSLNFIMEFDKLRQFIHGIQRHIEQWIPNFVFPLRSVSMADSVVLVIASPTMTYETELPYMSLDWVPQSNSSLRALIKC